LAVLRTWKLLSLVATASAIVLAGCGSDSETTTTSSTPLLGSQSTADCISTASEYQKAWNSREERCVAPTLFATVHGTTNDALYPDGFLYAWASSNFGLESYLTINKRYHSEPAKVGLGVLSFIGFPGLETWNNPSELAVYSLSDDVPVGVPSFEFWFRLFDEQSNGSVDFPSASQTDLAYVYSTLSSFDPEINEDVVGAFEQVTGCSRTALLAGKQPTAKIGCNAEFTGALAAAGDSPYTAGAKTISCIRDFDAKYKGTRGAAALRAVLMNCQDAGFLNTGVGVEYNTYPNPLRCGSAKQQTVRQRYTGQEFVLPNQRFSDLPEVVNIPLEFGSTKERDFLQDGYC
jgi:hypothetical protein